MTLIGYNSMNSVGLHIPDVTTEELQVRQDVIFESSNFVQEYEAFLVYRLIQLYMCYID